MPDSRIVEWIRSKFVSLTAGLGERARRHWAAVEAASLGRGGIAAVAEATGISDRTIRKGIRELCAAEAWSQGRQRRVGGGRKRVEQKNPDLLRVLEGLIDPVTRGDPMSPLKWTCKSTRELSQELQRRGHFASRTKVAKLLKQAGYSLQANRKTVEGKQHHDRNAQFEHINRRVKAQLRTGQPAISVDTKKKEIVGNFKNSGRTWRRKGQPVHVNTHDFPDKEKGKVVPYGVYDIAQNEAWVNVGISHDTAEFAVASIRRWWDELGQQRYPKTTVGRILITADSGGSNGSRSRLWKYELQRLADELGIEIEVCHFPPGTSKWNKVEHRLFCHITRTWRGQPLENHRVVIQLIGSTKTEAGLEVHATLDEREYRKGIQVSREEFATLAVKPCRFHGEWNYVIKPRPKRNFVS